MSAAAELVEVLVEWIAGDPHRYEWDDAAGVLRPSEHGRVPPEHYGCVPRTRSADGEALDVLLLQDGATRRPGDRVRARLVGVLRREDGDHKLLAVDPARLAVADVAEIDAERLGRMWRWFRRQHVLIGWFGPAEAYSVLAEARRDREQPRG